MHHNIKKKLHEEKRLVKTFHCILFAMAIIACFAQWSPSNRFNVWIQIRSYTKVPLYSNACLSVTTLELGLNKVVF